MSSPSTSPPRRCCCCPHTPPADPAAANEAIRAYVRAHGDRPWDAAACAELGRLRAVWLDAVRGQMC